jgi:curved DNA-binding protein CbpA
VARTHYEVLGVSSESSTEDVRQAYYRLARVLHPDRVDGSTTDAEGAGRRMQEVNDAWRVLRNPQARADYDRTLRAAPPMNTSPTTFDTDVARPAGADWSDTGDLDRPIPTRLAEPGDLGLAIVRALPWLVLVVVLGAIFVFTAFARNDDDPAPFELVGKCVSGGGDGLTAVSCAEPNEGVVIAIVEQASLCPPSTTARAGEDDTWLCLRPAVDVDIDEPGP